MHWASILSGVKRFDILTLIFMTYFTLLRVYRWSWCRKFPYWKRPSWFISLNIFFHFHPMNAQNPPPSHLFVQVQKDQYHELLCDMVSFYISMTFHLFLYIFNKSVFFYSYTKQVIEWSIYSIYLFIYFLFESNVTVQVWSNSAYNRRLPDSKLIKFRKFRLLNGDWIYGVIKFREPSNNNNKNQLQYIQKAAIDLHKSKSRTK